MSKVEPKQQPAPPDFRFFRLSQGAQVTCPNPKHIDNWDQTRFTVRVSESALTLTCESCGDSHVVIVNKLAE